VRASPLINTLSWLDEPSSFQRDSLVERHYPFSQGEAAMYMVVVLFASFVVIALLSAVCDMPGAD
jgi:hypothetical protein